MMLTAASAFAPAFADDYTDLLNILQAKGSLTHAEYTSLMAKHMHGGRGSTRGRRAVPTTMTPEDEEISGQTKRDALAAAASAAAADAAMRKAEMMETEMASSPDIVHAMPYKLGQGVTIRVGSVDLNFSGIVNGFYTFSSADKGVNTTVGGGLADASGFDSSAIRNGLLPGAFIVSASTTQEGIDVSAVFGVYPGIDSSNVSSPFNANSGGSAVALGTAGVDFRKTYLTFGTKDLGTIKIGRDLAIFGSDAILNDQTLLAVGATGGNADPGNTSLGRIGLGYIYADFEPQITYTSPIFAGFQASVGAFQPLNEVDFAGSESEATSPYLGEAFSGTATAHNTPGFEGKLTYDFVNGTAFKAHAWAGFIVQPQQNIVTAAGFATGKDKTAGAGEAGAALTFGPFGLTGYYYRGKGVGTTGKFLDGISAGGDLRDSEGGYIQGSFKVLPKLKLSASYGESSLYQAAGDVDPNLVRRNEAEVGAAYYTLTDWVTLVGEYAHQEDKSHGPNSATSDAVTAGAILFY